MTAKHNPCLSVPRALEDINFILNKTGFEMTGSKDNCILVSHALNHVLSVLGYKSRVVRITVGVFPDDRKYHGVTLGSDGDGFFRPAAGPDMWHGHVAVLVDERWILDPTIDQVNKDGITMPPLALELEYLDGRQTALNINGCYVRYNIYHKQVGFKHAGDARRSHWMPLAVVAAYRLAGQAFSVQQCYASR